ncbi:hypothetical protein Hanom_Chr04g00354111 [Helianthus anomalus]
MLFPAVAEINDACPKHVFKSLNRSLRLPIRLRVICSCHSSDVNRASRSEIIDVGTPCLETTSLR